MRTRMWIAAAAVFASAVPAAAEGNMTAVVDPTTGELRIAGDELSNDIEITWDGTPGGYVVTGRNGTTVNGAASFTADGARGILVDFFGGNDRLTVSETRIRGALRVRGGDGDDAVTLNGAKLRGRAAIRGGLGADRVVLIGASVFNSTFVFNAEGGDDTIDARNAEFRNRVRVDSGSGNDTMMFTDCDWQGFARFEVEARTGDDTLEMTNCELDNDMFVDMGRDDDHVVLDDSDFNGEVDVSGGGGHDDLSVRSGVSFRGAPGFHAFED